MRPISSLLAVVLGLLGVSCGEPSSPPGPVAFMKVVSGNSQTGVVGAELASPVVVQVMDALGRPAAGQLVTFHVLSGGGSVSAGSVAADADGMAQERWTLGPGARPQQMEARAADAQTGSAVSAAFEATAVPGAPVLITGGTVVVPPSLRPRTATVLVQDAFGNGVDGVPVSFATGAGSGSASPATVTTQNGGQAQTNWTIGVVVGEQTVTAAAAGMSPFTIRQQMTFGDVASGTYVGPVTFVSANGPVPVGECEGIRSFTVPWNDGLFVTGSYIAADGSFNQDQRIGYNRWRSFQGVIVVGAGGAATASGKYTYWEIGGICEGTFTSMIRQ